MVLLKRASHTQFPLESATLPSGQSFLLHSATVLLHAPHSPGTHSPVAALQVTVRVCVPQLLHVWLDSGCVPVHSQVSAIEQVLQALQVPVVVSHVLV